MTQDGSWTQSNNKKSTFHAGGGGNPRQRGGTRNKRKFTPRCWNCGGSHLLSACDQEHDEAKIAANREAYNKNRAANPPRNPPRDDQNRPLKYNRNQVLVVDTQRLKDEQSPTPDALTSTTTTTSRRRNRRNKKDKEASQDVVSKAEVRTLLTELRSDASVSSPSPSVSQTSLIQSRLDQVIASLD